MRKHYVSILALGLLALGACERANQATGDTAAQPSQVVADSADASPDAVLQAQLEAAFLGKTTPPDPEGFTSVGGGLDGETIGVGAIWVVYGRWTHAGGDQWVAYAQRTIGTEPVGERGHLPAEIVSVLAIPAPRAGELILSEYCSHPDYPEPTGRIFAMASTRPDTELTNPPSAAWRLDRASARLLPLEPAGITCSVEPS